LITISDIDAAPTETLTLTVSSGTLTMNFSGILAGLTTITAGANGSSTITLRGAISELNAALATLTYAAPAGGTTASLTAQANDGSLTNTLTTTITLTGSTTLDYTSAGNVPVTSSGFTASGALSLTLEFAPVVGGTVLTAVSNTSANPISGTFTNLPEGSVLSASYGGTTYYFTISYVGGDGNDITLTSIQPVPASIQVRGSMGFRRAMSSPR
jgi:hypothetical protein